MPRLRIVSMLAVFGALINVVYSIYILIIAFVKDKCCRRMDYLITTAVRNVFFDISVFFFILSEYILNMKNSTIKEYSKHIRQEFGSDIITRHSKINLRGDKLN